MLIIENRVIFYYFEGAYEFFYNALRKSSNDTINTFMVAVEGNTYCIFATMDGEEIFLQHKIRVVLSITIKILRIRKYNIQI